MKNKKLIVIVATLAVAVAGVAAIAYIISKDKESDGNPGAYYGSTADGFTTGFNKDEHIGAINVVSKPVVETAFGEGVEVGDPEESGTVRLGTTKSETATFPIKTSRGDVVFEVDVRTYASKDDLGKAGIFVGAEEPKVEDVGEEAHYFVPAQQDIFTEQQVGLLAKKDKTSYKFAIVQQTDNTIYTVDEAKAIVLEIAKKAKLSEVK